MAWEIIYSDLSTASCRDMNWTEAPGWDVQIILFKDPAFHGMWTIRHGAEPGGSPGDFYRLDHDGSIVGMDTAGFIGHAVNDLGCDPDTPLEDLLRTLVLDAGIIKQGRMLSTAHWQEVLNFGIKFRNELRDQDGST